MPSAPSSRNTRSRVCAFPQAGSVGRTEDENLLLRLGDTQVLTLQAEAVSSDDRVLRIAIRGGRWDWTEYGGDQEHTEVLGSGNVEFHAPFHP